MNKYIFWSVLMSAIFFSSPLLFCVEFEVTHKEFAQLTQTQLKNKGKKILDIVPLDTDKSGYVKIIYQ